MSDDEINPVNSLVEISKGELETHPAFAALSEVREEQAWLANFASQNTRDAYARAVGSFLATVGVTTPEDLYAVNQAHVLAWRASMERAGLSPASIASRLASLSSLFKHLTDRQLTLSNPVAGVRRPKTGNARMGAGKSPTLSKRQVRSMLDAPDTTKLQGLRDRSLLHIYFYAGARCSEPTLPRVKDVGYDNEHFLWEMVTSSLRRVPIIGKVFKRGQSHPILCSGCRWGSLMKEFKNATDISFPRGSDNLGAHDFTTENVARLSVLPSVPGLLSR